MQKLVFIVACGILAGCGSSSSYSAADVTGSTETPEVIHPIGVVEGEKLQAGLFGKWMFDDARTCGASLSLEKVENELHIESASTDCNNTNFLTGIFSGRTYSIKPMNRRHWPKAPYRSELTNGALGIFDSESLVGWIDENEGKIGFYDQSNQLMNGLGLSAVYSGEAIHIKTLRFTEKRSMVSDVEFVRVNEIPDDLSVFFHWDLLELPASAQLSTGRDDRNFLFCFDPASPSHSSLNISLAPSSYTVGSEGIARRIGILDSSGGRVELLRVPSSGEIFAAGALSGFSLKSFGGGNRFRDVTIYFDDTAYAFVFTQIQTEAHFCQFLKNDMYQGISGWEP